jgi:lipoate-protein ligase A
VTPSLTGAENMALDEAILDCLPYPDSPPILRVYGWDPPCLSLGVAQPAAEVDRERLTARGWDLVRRPTGGRAILHTQELTYSVIAGSRREEIAGGVLESYRRLSQALIAGLSHLGLSLQVGEVATPAAPAPVDPVCFQTPSAFEVLASGRKLVGSAQVRRREGVLQHGSIPLSGDLGAICEALVYPDEQARRQAAGRVRDRATTVTGVLGRKVGWQEAADALAFGFAFALGADLQPSAATATELARAEELKVVKYAAEEWTSRK